MNLEMKRTKYGWWIGAGTMLIITILFSGYCLWQNSLLTAQQLTLEKQNNSLQTQVTAFEAQLQNGGVGTTVTPVIFPNVSKIYEYFADYVQRSNLKIERFSLPEDEADPKATSRLLEIEVLGTYPGLIQFFNYLSGQVYLYSLEKMTVSNIEQAPYTIKAVFKIKIPMAKGASK